jgi:hypothetical protein
MRRDRTRLLLPRNVTSLRPSTSQSTHSPSSTTSSPRIPKSQRFRHICSRRYLIFKKVMTGEFASQKSSVRFKKGLYVALDSTSRSSWSQEVVHSYSFPKSNLNYRISRYLPVFSKCWVFFSFFEKFQDHCDCFFQNRKDLEKKPEDLFWNCQAKFHDLNSILEIFLKIYFTLRRVAIVAVTI